MTSTLLIVHSFPGGNDTFALHYQRYYKRCGAHVIGIGTEDGLCTWPEGCSHADIGRNEYAGRGLIERLVTTFELCASAPAWQTDFCVVEYDTIVLPLPLHPGGFVTHVGGHKSQGFKADEYYHTPWWADRQTSAMIADCGRRMLRENDIEHGFPDRFLGWMFQRFHFPPIVRAKAYSQNNIAHNPRFIAEARQALKDGALFCHGVKDIKTLDTITDIYD